MKDWDGDWLCRQTARVFSGQEETYPLTATLLMGYNAAAGQFKLKEVSVAVSVNAEGGRVSIGVAGVEGGISLKFKP